MPIKTDTVTRSQRVKPETAQILELIKLDLKRQNTDLHITDEDVAVCLIVSYVEARNLSNKYRPIGELNRAQLYKRIKTYMGVIEDDNKTTVAPILGIKPS
jgi:hypothetical protein